MNHLYLVRHGENYANLTLEFSHHKVDYSLTPKGELQARQTAAFFRDRDICAIYSSPLKRALETARIIADSLNLPVIPVENFREMNVGDLEGQKPTPELWAQHNAIVQAWFTGHPETRFPGGEDYVTLLNRTRTGFEYVLGGKDASNIIIVGHGGQFSIFISNMVSGTDPDRDLGTMHNCSVTELEAGIVAGKLVARLLSFAQVGHLSGDAANLVPGYMKAEDTGRDGGV